MRQGGKASDVPKVLRFSMDINSAVDRNSSKDRVIGGGRGGGRGRTQRNFCLLWCWAVVRCETWRKGVVESEMKLSGAGLELVKNNKSWR